MNLLEGLNDQQREAVLCTEGPLLIVAGAGTGKTMALTYRIAYLIQEKKVDPQQILAVTFTNKAAGEMKERIEELLKDSGLHGLPTIGTFHSICVQILRREIQHLGYEKVFVIYDAEDALALVKRVMQSLQISEKEFNPKAVLSTISAAKNVLQTPSDVQQVAHNHFQQKVGVVYERYQQELKRLSALDFDDLIMKTIELFECWPALLKKYQQRWQYLHVDEYQDTNMAQYRLIQRFSSAQRNLCVVGDPDQNIYSWRGADITNILNFSREYSEARVVKLEQNYRSTPSILQAAEAVIAENQARIEKQLWTEKVSGAKVQLIDVDDERAEAELVIQMVSDQIGRLRRQVVLYRTHAQSRVVEEACLRAGIPYKVIGGVKFYARKEVKDIVAYLRLIHNPRDDGSLIRIINTPPRQIGAKTLETLQRQAALYGTSLFLVLVDQGEKIAHLATSSKMSQLKTFIALIQGLQEFAHEFSVSTLIREILHRTHYDRMLLEEPEIGEVRLQNIQELITVAKKYDDLEPGIGLTTFLEEVALVSNIDELQGSDDYLTLMTVHSAKGLEFETVYVVGLEEGIFPHSQAFFDPQQMEEERRLMYVAMTRAKEYLYLIWARRRLLFGETQYNPPSSFLRAIPSEAAEGDFFAAVGEDQMVRKIRSFTSFRSFRNQDYLEGDSIEHQKFGRGVIRSLKGDIAEVDFGEKGIKKIALNVAQVKKVR